VKAKQIPQRAVLAKVKSGEIAMELGGDGVYLRFDCDCEDALPYCKAACCGLHGIDVTVEELKQTVTYRDEGGKSRKMLLAQLATKDEEDGPEMKRRSDSFCTCLHRGTRMCGIYADRPATCSEFHCTKGPAMRGWKLDLSRQVSHE
jgi:hypothetical protein